MTGTSATSISSPSHFVPPSSVPLSSYFTQQYTASGYPAGQVFDSHGSQYAPSGSFSDPFFGSSNQWQYPDRSANSFVPCYGCSCFYCSSYWSQAAAYDPWSPPTYDEACWYLRRFNVPRAAPYSRYNHNPYTPLGGGQIASTPHTPQVISSQRTAVATTQGPSGKPDTANLGKSDVAVESISVAPVPGFPISGDVAALSDSADVLPGVEAKSRRASVHDAEVRVCDNNSDGTIFRSQCSQDIPSKSRRKRQRRNARNAAHQGKDKSRSRNVAAAVTPRGVASLEDGISLGRDCESQAGEPLRSQPDIGSGVVSFHEGDAVPACPISSGPSGGSGGSVSSVNSSTVVSVAPDGAADNSANIPIERTLVVDSSVGGSPSTAPGLCESLHSVLDQTRGDHTFESVSGGRSSSTSSSSVDGATRDVRSDSAGHHGAVYGGRSGNGVGSGSAARHDSSLTSRFAGWRTSWWGQHKGHNPTVPDDETRKWKWHCKKTGVISIEQLLAMPKGDKIQSMLLSQLSLIYDPLRMAQCCTEPDPDAGYVSGKSLAECEPLLSAGICEHHPPNEAVGRIGRLFTVPEYRKIRLRVIYWPKFWNEDILKTWISTLKLEPPQAHMRQLKDGCWAVSYDATSSFYQVGLPVDQRKFFVFRTSDGVLLRFTRMVMGCRPAPEIMQTIFEALDDGNCLKGLIHIDNIRWIGTREQVTAAAAYFMKRAELCNFQMNVEPQNQPHQQGEFCGLMYNLSVTPPTVDVTPHLRDTIRDSWAVVHRATIRDFAALISRLLWSSAILHLDISSDMYYAIKCYRRRVQSIARGAAHYDDAARIWPVALVQLEAWVSLVLNASPYVVDAAYEERPQHYVMYTDASEQGWGAILIDVRTGKLESVGARWTPQDSQSYIAQLEMRAIRLALQRWTHISGRLDLYVDNTTSIGVLRRGRSNSFWMNNEVGKLLPHIPAAQLNIAYIKSAENPADPLSRSKPLDNELLSQQESLRQQVNSNCRQPLHRVPWCGSVSKPNN